MQIWVVSDVNQQLGSSYAQIEAPIYPVDLDAYLLLSIKEKNTLATGTKLTIDQTSCLIIETLLNQQVWLKMTKEILKKKSTVTVIYWKN